MRRAMLCCLAALSVMGLGVAWAAEAEKSEATKPVTTAPEATKAEPAGGAAPTAVAPAGSTAEATKPVEALKTDTPADAKKAADDAAADVKKAEVEKRKAAAEAKKAAKAAGNKKSYGGGKFAAEPTFQDDFLPDWEKNQKDWAVATWKQNGAQMAPERCATDGKGFLVQTVMAGEPYLGGSMETKNEYRYGRWVGRIKPAPVAGALNSFFTIDWDNHTTPEKNDGTKLEIDIEFVTASFGSNKGQVEFAVHHLGDKKSFGKVINLDFNPSDEFHIWGFDILPEGIIWHVDGKVLHEYKCPAGETIPDIGHEFFMNSWTAVKWVRGPAKADAKYYIDWVQFYPLAKR